MSNISLTLQDTLITGRIVWDLYSLQGYYPYVQWSNDYQRFEFKKDVESAGSFLASSMILQENNHFYRHYEIKPPDNLDNNLTFILPSNSGDNGDILSTDGSGNTSWVTSTSSYEYTYGTAGADLSAKKAVISDSSGIIYADSSEISHMGRIMGITDASVINGEQVKIITSGLIENNTWSWDLTKPIFLSEDGELTQTPPSTGFIQIIAKVFSATKIIFEPQMCIGL